MKRQVVRLWVAIAPHGVLIKICQEKEPFGLYKDVSSHFNEKSPFLSQMMQRDILNYEEHQVNL